MDPEIQNPTEFAYYVAQNGISTDWSKRSHAQLVKDVNVLHDFVRKLVKEKDEINAKLADALDRLKWEGIWVKILTAAVVAQWFAIGVLVKELLPFMVKH